MIPSGSSSEIQETPLSALVLSRFAKIAGGAASVTGIQTGSRVHHVRDLSPSAYVLRFDRNGLAFQPGQYLLVGLAGKGEMREFTVYSASQDDYLEILVKEIEGGLVSRALRRCRPGDRLRVEGSLWPFHDR